MEKDVRRCKKCRIITMGLIIIWIIWNIIACTNNLFIIKGVGNTLRNENNTEVKTDSVTVKVDVK